MESRIVDGIDILLWTHRLGQSAFAAPWVFDLEYDAEGRGTIDAWFHRLNVGDYPSRIDRYRALGGPEKARVLKAALDRRDDYLVSSSEFEQYLVKLQEPGIDEPEFLRIVGRFMEAWRRKNGLA